VPRELLVALGVPHALLARLRDDGQLVEEPDRVRLRVEARVPVDAQHRLDVARALAADGRDEAVLEAARLLVDLAATDALSDLLDARADTLCERGLSAELWAILARLGPLEATPQRIARWRRWAAFEWGDLRAARDVADLEAAEPDDPVLAHLQARIHIARGDFAAAEHAAARAVALAPSARQRDLARARLARALYRTGRGQAALETVDGIVDSGDAPRVEIAIVRAEALATLGRSGEAAAECEALLDAAPSLAPAWRLRALLGVARVRLMLQDLRGAEAALDVLLASRAGLDAGAVSARTAFELACMVATQRAGFDRVAALAQRLLRLEAAQPVRALFTRSFALTADEFTAAPAEFAERLERLARDAAASDSPIAVDVAGYCLALEARRRMLEGQPPENASPVPSGPTRGLDVSTELVRATHAARWGATAPLPHAQGLDHAALRGIAVATAAFVAADHVGALDALGRADEAIDAGGYELKRLDVLRLRAELGWDAGDAAAVRRAAASLEALATSAPAPRAAELAHFWRAVAEGALAPEQLEAWATDETGYARRRRYALHLLGETAPLDPIEVRLLAHLDTREGWGRIHTAQRGEARVDDAAGIDVVRQLIWHRGAVVAPLDRHDVLLRFVAELARRDLAATKEELVVAVWGVREYHPLRHDNRLRLAARKLRLRLGPLAGRLVATEDGYALNGRWRLRTAVGGGSPGAPRA
jgi:hypothetical protein